MATSQEPNQFNNRPDFAASEEEFNIAKKVEFELDKSHSGVIKLGSLANVIASIFVVIVLRAQIPPNYLLVWFGVLMLTNSLNVVWAYIYQKPDVTYEQLRRWRQVMHFMLFMICLTWGSIGIIFTTTNVYYELYIITFLQVAALGFCFGSVVDFMAAFICTATLLLPTIVYRIYLGLHATLTGVHDSGLNLAFGINLLILAVFLIAMSAMGNRLLKNFFKLSLKNILLNEKLENMNKFLELRVKERTVELENTLKLVTHQATHDSLTDLPNQRSLLDYINDAIKSSANNNHMFAVILFSLNEIEKINDGLGYQAGEKVISTVAQRFKNMFVNKQFGDLNFKITLSRKDVFVILLDPISSIDEIEIKLSPLFLVLEEPVITEKQSLKLTASIGVSVSPRDGYDIDTLLIKADASLFQAKQQGGNFVSINEAKTSTNISHQLEIAKNLHTAIQNNEFKLQFQPVINLQTGHICSAEALIRWNSPTLGYVMPDNFIPIAEATGIIVPLGEWVLRTACEQVKCWHDMGFISMRVAVNLSAKQLLRKNLTLKIKDILDKTGIAPEYIELELTESVAFQKEVVPLLKQFKRMGFGLSIDDFGTGYSGLSNLKLFSIDTLKIDKSFVRDLMTNNDSRAIVSNTIALAKKINVKIIAEGVETREQLNFLIENGCDMIQGYYYSPPIDADAISHLLDRARPIEF
jgi:diguanylate cyclase (GGDEF)-like protein